MFYKSLAVFKIAFIIFLMIQINIYANPSGIIKGKLVDAETQSPLVGANVTVVDFALGAATDHEGYFVITSVPPGAYSLQLSYIGYQYKIKTDIIIKPGRSVYIEESLNPQTLNTDVIVVDYPIIFNAFGIRLV